MSTLNIGGRNYLIISMGIQNHGNCLQVYNCPDCSAIVTDAERHNEWHREMRWRAAGK